MTVPLGCLLDPDALLSPITFAVAYLVSSKLFYRLEKIGYKLAKRCECWQMAPEHVELF